MNKNNCLHYDLGKKDIRPHKLFVSSLRIFHSSTHMLYRCTYTNFTKRDPKKMQLLNYDNTEPVTINHSF